MIRPPATSSIRRALPVLILMVATGLSAPSYAANDTVTSVASNTLSATEMAAKNANDAVQAAAAAATKSSAPVTTPAPTTTQSTAPVQATPASTPTVAPSTAVENPPAASTTSSAGVMGDATNKTAQTPAQPATASTAALAGPIIISSVAKPIPITAPIIDTIHNYTARMSDHYSKADTISSPLAAAILKGSAGIAALGFLLLIVPVRSGRRMSYKVPVSDAA